MMQRFNEFVLRFPKSFILAIAIITLGMGYASRSIRMEPDVTQALPQKIPAKRLYDKMGEIFPSKEFVFVGLSGTNLFLPAHLQTVWDLTNKLEHDSAVYSVISPTNISVIQGTREGMEVHDILASAPNTDDQIAKFKHDLLNSDLALGNLLAKDESAFGIMIFLKNTADVKEYIKDLIPAMDQFDQKTDLDLLLTGKPILNYYVSLGMQRDMAVFFMSGIGIIFILLAFIFRNLRGIFLPLSVVIFAVIWTMGAMAILGRPMSHATEIMPILIMAIAVADSIHIISHFYHHVSLSPDPVARTITRATMTEMLSPVVMTSLTTMAGFLALGTVGAESISELGYFTAFGVFSALIISITWIPAFLAILKIPKRYRGKESRRHAADWVEKWGFFLVRRQKWLMPFIVLMTLFSIWGISRLQHSFSSVENFPVDHPVRFANEIVNEHFAGTTSFDIMIEGREPGDMKDPVLLSQLDELKQLALKIDHVGSVQSLADFIKRINKVLHADDPAFYTIPPIEARVTGSEWVEKNGGWVEVSKEYTVSGEELVAQYLQLFEMSGKPQDMSNLVDYPYRHAKVSIMINSDKQSTLRAIDQELTTYINENMNRNENISAAITGMAKLFLVVDDLIVKGQIWSILTSLLLVWVITWAMFRSPTVGLFNTIPLFFALFLNFAFMGFAGINLNLETLTISSIAIGVGVDYAIHFVHRYRIKLREGLDYDAAVPATMREAGLAIFFNSITVAAGFSIIAMSQFVAIMEMGVLITLTMLTAAFGALTILPGVFLTFKPKSLAR